MSCLPKANAGTGKPTHQPNCSARLMMYGSNATPHGRGQTVCRNCGKVFAEDFALSNCPACKASLETGKPPGEPAKSTKPEFTADSPMWESRTGDLGFIVRSRKTCVQFITRPLATFAAPRSRDYFPAFMFFFIGLLINVVTVKVFMMVISLIFPERIQELAMKGHLDFTLKQARELGPVFVAAVYGALSAMVTAGLLTTGLHIFVRLVSWSRKSFTTSFQVVSYTVGFYALLSVPVSILAAGISLAVPSGSDFGLFAEKLAILALMLFSLFLLFVGIMASHKLSRVKAALSVILPLAMWMMFILHTMGS